MARSLRVIGALFFLAAGAILAGSQHTEAKRGEYSPAAAVFYVANTDFSVQICLPGGCELRAYVPSTGEDILIARHDDIPKAISWEDNFRWLYFLANSKIFRVQWRSNSKVEYVAELPRGDALFAGLWYDPVRKTLRLAQTDYSQGWTAQLLEFSPENSSWTLIEERPTNCECDLCTCAREIVPKLVSRFDPTNKILGFNGLLVYPDAAELFPCPSDSEVEVFRPTGNVFLPSTSVERRGLSFPYECFRGIPHALPPVTYGENAETADTIVVPGETERSGTVYFEEMNGYLLIEESGRPHGARVIDMRSGEVLRKLPEFSSSVVWVKAPSN